MRRVRVQVQLSLLSTCSPGRGAHVMEGEAAGGCRRLLSVWVGRPAGVRDLYLPLTDCGCVVHVMEGEAAGVLPPFRKRLGRAAGWGSRPLPSAFPSSRCSSAVERSPHKAGRRRFDPVYRYERVPQALAVPAAGCGAVAQVAERPGEIRQAEVRGLPVPRPAAWCSLPGH